MVRESLLPQILNAISAKSQGFGSTKDEEINAYYELCASKHTHELSR